MKRLTTEEFIKKLPDGFKLLSEYKNSRQRIHTECMTCRHQFWILPVDLIRRKSCPVCSGRLRKSHSDFLKEIPDSIECLQEYKNTRTKLKFRCKKCNYEFFMTPNHLLSGNGCPKCAGVKKKSTEEFREEVKKLTNDEYSVLSEYKSNKIKILMNHKLCGNNFLVRPNDFLSGSRCPFCFQSKNEILIENFLKENKIQYERQKAFKECKDKQHLRFDFYLPNENIVIEYDGEFHYKDIFGTLEDQKKKDAIKNSFCENNGIKIIRISYLEKDNLYDILNNEIIKHI